MLWSSLHNHTYSSLVAMLHFRTSLIYLFHRYWVFPRCVACRRHPVGTATQMSLQLSRGCWFVNSYYTNNLGTNLRIKKWTVETTLNGAEFFLGRSWKLPKRVEPEVKSGDPQRSLRAFRGRKLKLFFRHTKISFALFTWTEAPRWVLAQNNEWMNLAIFCQSRNLQIFKTMPQLSLFSFCFGNYSYFY